MKKVFFVVSPLFLALGIFLGVTWYLNRISGKGALQVTASPKSNVYLNGALIGQTPLRKSEGADTLDEGEYTLKIVPLEPGFTKFEQKITIASAVLTVVDWTFGSGATSEGSIITLSPVGDKQKAQLLVISIPQGADILFDNSPKGNTPLLLSDVPDSDHEVMLSKAGYADKTLRVHTTLGYKLLATVFLGLSSSFPSQEAQESTSSATPVISGKTLSPSPLPPSGQATPTQAKTPTTKSGQKVLILETPNGFLRVREQPTTESSEIARIKPGETYPLLSEQSGWFEIALSTGESGWISGAYAEKQ